MRLLTRADLDGVVCAAMIMEHEDVSEIVFTHPKDMQDGLIEVQKGDGISNLPFHPNAGLWFDHHDKAEEVEEMPEGVRGRVDVAKSAARLVYEYYAAQDLHKYEDMLEETDRLDSATLTMEDVLDPGGWILLGYTLDPRTGLGGFRDYSMEVIEAIKEGKTIDEILEMPSVQGRVNRYFADGEIFKKALMECTTEDGNVSITDFRPLDKTPTGNRFLVFALFPDSDVNVRIYRHRDASKIMVAAGKSIFIRTHPGHIGKLMADYEGGGLRGAGTCPVNASTAEQSIQEIVNKLKH
ncbi:MAG: hypothetical protein P9L92_20740 [Candidatus Electryonea clarkiae]|nr:hypothetical protein [Candidatus Electryonea clarkiae]MDP8287834.1 hypothetical protein [Candidatus Electryonea clarkiae]